MRSRVQKKHQSVLARFRTLVVTGVTSIKSTVESFLQQEDALDLCIAGLLLLMFPLSYLESLKWPFPGPKATHGILKGLFLLMSLVLVFFRKRLSKPKRPLQNLLMVVFVTSYFVSAATTFALDAAGLHLWYPSMACAILFAFSKVKLPRSFEFLLVGMSAGLVFITFAFSFFSLMFRYSVDNVYYFIFLDHRANHLLSELRAFGKYVSLGPYMMLAPLCYVFLLEKSSLYRKLLSIIIFFTTILTAVISNNRIDILVVGIQAVAVLFIFKRKLSLLILAGAVPFIVLGLTVTERYFGFNLEQRIFRPKVERDIETIDIRFTYWQTALYNFRNAPLFGTGPNSYNDVSIFPIRRYYDPNARQFLWKLDEGIGVHNIFIERLSDTGLFGFVSFMVLLSYFFRQDVVYLLGVTDQKKKKRYLLYLIGSWSWILYGVTDNGYGAQGFVLFFFLRGVMNHL